MGEVIVCIVLTESQDLRGTLWDTEPSAWSAKGLEEPQYMNGNPEGMHMNVD